MAGEYEAFNSKFAATWKQIRPFHYTCYNSLTRIS